MSDEDFAVEYACSLRMHQSFTLAATDSHEPLLVTYAVAGLQDDDAPTILLISGMFGGRWIALLQHHIAVKIGVRVVCVDRPGFGGSTPVPLSQRIAVWLETVPALMSHLKASYIIPIAASSGTIFLLNTLLQLPHILPPQHPYTSFLAPWVHPSKSHVTLLSLAASPLIPSSFISAYWNKINGFVATNMLPTLGASSGFLASFSHTSSSSSASTPDSAPDSATSSTPNKTSISEDEQKIIDAYGMTSKRKSLLINLQIKYMFAEDTTGANDEAILCLRKHVDDTNVSWGVCDDYEAYVPTLAERYKEHYSSMIRDGSFPVTTAATPQLKIQAYYASSDIMVGTGGPKYFESCWNEASCGDAIRFEGTMVKDSTHDSIGNATNGVLEKVYEEAKKALEGDAQGS